MLVFQCKQGDGCGTYAGVSVSTGRRQWECWCFSVNRETAVAMLVKSVLMICADGTPCIRVPEQAEAKCRSA